MLATEHLIIAPILIPLIAGALMLLYDESQRKAKLGISIASTVALLFVAIELLNRWVEDKLLATLDEIGTGCIAFSPLAQGMLTNKYLKSIPKSLYLIFSVFVVCSFSFFYKFTKKNEAQCKLN